MAIPEVPVNPIGAFLDLITQLACGAGIGFSTIALYGAWRKCAQQWAAWAPAKKQFLTLLFWGWALGTAITTTVVAQNPVLNLAYFLGGLVLGVAIPALALPYLLRAAAPRPVKAASGERTPLLVSTSSVRSSIAADRVPTRLDIGGVSLPFAAEPKHILLMGNAGAGKSPAINEVLRQLRAANDTVIVLDSEGKFLEQHYRKGTDFVLNPFDNRCVNWSPAQELHADGDFAALACSIVPDDGQSTPDVTKDAQSFVADVLQRMSLEKSLRLSSLLYFIEEAGVTELKQMLQGTNTVNLLANEPKFFAARELAVSRFASYAYLPDEGSPFSIAEMIGAEHSGFLFLTHGGEQASTLHGLLACALDVAARAILAQPPSSTRRTWLVLDGLGAVGKVQSLTALASKGSQFGGCLMVALQTLNDLAAVYGVEDTEHLVNHLETWLVLRTDKETAELMLPGLSLPEFVPAEVIASQAKKSDKASGRPGKALVRKTQSYADKFRTLPPMQGFLRVAGGYDICEVTVTPAGPPGHRALSFEARDFGVKPVIRAAAPGTLPDSTEDTVSTLARLVPELPPMPADSQILFTRHDHASRQGNRLSSVLKLTMSR